ncbi:hypothetical protein ACFL3V_03790 [Nanoarchaeota archaeon]
MMNVRTTQREYIAKPKEVEHVVQEFSDEITKELGELVKSVVFFGSRVKRSIAEGKREIRDEALFGSDIDVLLVFDDLVNVLTPELITAYRVVTEKVAANVSKRLHITTMPITKFWDYSSKGDPILINMLRDGNPVFDKGCFSLAKMMLGTGRIKPSKEVVWIYMARGPMSISNANWNMKQAVIDLHWAVIDAAHAALLHHGVIPDTPEHLVPLVRHHLVDKNFMHKKDLSIVSEFQNIGGMLMRGETERIRGTNFDRYRQEAHDFIHVVRDIISN